MSLKVPTWLRSSEWRDAIFDFRFLLNRGYKRKSALDFVTSRYRLSKEARNVLFRSIYPRNICEMRSRKRRDEADVLWVDGFNVLITVESILNDETLILCDDGVIRDFRGVFGKYRWNERSEEAVKLIGEKIKEISENAIILLDSQVSRSRELAGELERMTGIETRVSRSVDRELKQMEFVATSDGTIIDAVRGFIDIPRMIIEERGGEVYSTSIANFLTVGKERH
ncbi:MAG: hypothetical protein PWR13_263 [Archaeoglobi archaeon]|nr:hypothetical protein [Archaeoglobi archaeon]MDK2781235.1 hypothetical protein [Archaeoglobi archaeon]